MQAETAKSSRRASSPGRAAICKPSGSPFAQVIGTEMAGVPSAVQAEFMRGSPVDSRPARRRAGRRGREHDRILLKHGIHFTVSFQR